MPLFWLASSCASTPACDAPKGAAATSGTTVLSADAPRLWRSDGFLTGEQIAHALNILPPSDDWRPCIAAHIKCASLQVDDVLAPALGQLETLLGTELAGSGRTVWPLIRYSANAPATPVHSDAYNHDPSHPPHATLLIYLTAAPVGGRTLFPHANASVTPVPGTLAAVVNVDGNGEPDASSAHAVEALPPDAADRIVVQLPVSLVPAGESHGCPPRRIGRASSGFVGGAAAAVACDLFVHFIAPVGQGLTALLRSGETEDTFIADLAVGLKTGQIMAGAGSPAVEVPGGTASLPAGTPCSLSADPSLWICKPAGLECKCEEEGQGGATAARRQLLFSGLPRCTCQ